MNIPQQDGSDEGSDEGQRPGASALFAPVHGPHHTGCAKMHGKQGSAGHKQGYGVQVSVFVQTAQITFLPCLPFCGCPRTIRMLAVTADGKSTLFYVKINGEFPNYFQKSPVAVGFFCGFLS